MAKTLKETKLVIFGIDLALKGVNEVYGALKKAEGRKAKILIQAMQKIYKIKAKVLYG